MNFLSSHQIKAVLFDIDGTLYPKCCMNKNLLVSALSAPLFSIRYNNMRSRMRMEDGLAVGPALDRDAFREKEARLLYKKGYDLASYLSKYERLFESRWDELFKNIVPYPGMFDTLKKAKDSGCLLGALSDFPLGHKLETLKIASLCDFKASSEDYGYLKPNPVPFAAMLDAMNIKANEALYIGDSYSKDIVGAKNVGFYTCYLTKKKGKPDMADISVNSWYDLYDELF